MEIKEGDVFHWSWKQLDPISQQAGTSYWCMDQQCVAREKDGKMLLIDTYNYNQYTSEQIFGIEGLKGEFVKYLDIDKVEISFICNVDKLEVVTYGKEDYETVYDLSFQKRCYKLFAIPKDTEPSNKVILANKIREKEQLESDVVYSLKKIQWLKEEIEELQSKQ